MGARYHDDFMAVAGQGVMSEWARATKSASRASRLPTRRVLELVRENQDDI